MKVEPVMFDGREICVPAALPGAPEFRTVRASEQRADELRLKIPDTLDERAAIPTADIRVALDFRDAAGTAVASAAVGLESYANYHLQRLVASGDEVRLPGDESLTLDELRDLPLHDRYRVALPYLMDREKPTSEKWWSDLRRIQGLAALQRHAITEPRKRSGLQGERSLAQRLYAAEYRGAASMMLSVFEYFSPGWIDEQRRQALSAEP